MASDLHDAISFSRLSSFCKLIVPIGLPLLGRSKHYFLCGKFSSDHSLVFLSCNAVSNTFMLLHCAEHEFFFIINVILVSQTSYWFDGIFLLKNI